MFPTTETKNHKIVIKSAEKGFEKILLTNSQYQGTLNAIQQGQQFITIGELGRTFKKTDIQEISKINESERNRYSSNTPITIQEDLFIVDLVVQKYNGESIWLEIRKQGEQTLSTKKICYIPTQDGKSRKRIYIS